MIPRQIFCFWDTEDLPWFAQRCIESWRQEGWKIHIVTDNTAHVTRAPRGYDTLIPQHKSDWRRLDLLAEHGGVWMDATCFALQGPEAWFNLDSDCLQGFSRSFPPKRVCDFVGLTAVDVTQALGWDVCIENWAFAAPPRHPMVLAWRAEFLRALEMGVHVYCNGQSNLCVSQMTFNLPYHTQHLCFTKIVQRHGIKKLHLRPSHNCGGPLDFNVQELVELRALPPRIPFLKFTGYATRMLMNRINDGKFLQQAMFIRLLEVGQTRHGCQRQPFNASKLHERYNKGDSEHGVGVHSRQYTHSNHYLSTRKEN